MKRMKKLLAAILAFTLIAGPATALAADTKPAAKAKPYPLKTCLVSDEELESMGKPFVFIHEGQEIKLCCKSCQKDFNKDPKKYVKKLETLSKKKR